MSGRNLPSTRPAPPPRPPASPVRRAGAEAEEGATDPASSRLPSRKPAPPPRERVSVAVPVDTPTAAKGSSPREGKAEQSKKSSNPFRDSYDADRERSSGENSGNPFSVEEPEPKDRRSLVDRLNPFSPFRSSLKRDTEEGERSPRQDLNPFSSSSDDRAEEEAEGVEADAEYHPYAVPQGGAYLVRENPLNSVSTRFDSSDSAQTISSVTSQQKRVSLQQKREYRLSQQRKLGMGDASCEVYHKTCMSTSWLYVFLLLHTAQFCLLLAVGFKALGTISFTVVLGLNVAVVVLVVAARLMVTKSHLSKKRNIEFNNGICTPSDEADVVPDNAVLCVGVAAILEGFAFAVFTAVSSGNYAYLAQDGFYTKGTLLQVLRFTSITLLSLHRIIRPANRLDPLRTVLELELVSICWDALDGSTLYELIADGQHGNTSNAIRTLMAAWYFSVGVRMFIMNAVSLSPQHPLHRALVTAPYALAPQATVDRTLQGLRLRAIITMTMAVADLYAAVLRTVLWSQGKLDTLQQEMCLKNYLFLASFAGAYYSFQNTTNKEWNARELLEWPLVVKIPRRSVQLEALRWTFAVSYLLISVLLSVVLLSVMHPNGPVANIILDCVLIIVFFKYTKNAHVHEPTHVPTACCKPHSGFFNFPWRMAAMMGAALGLSLLCYRLPSAYLHYEHFAASSYSYDTAMLLVIGSIVPLAAFSGYWSIAFMLFRKEFTAAPGNYHAIHDPSIIMVVSVTQMEGALDVLSSVTLMQLAVYELPLAVNHAVVIFCLLELLNAALCFTLPCTLSGGYDDTPKDLVRYNAMLRVARSVLDLGAIVLRTVLWIKYRAVSSVFLIKNVYNLIHTATQVDRYSGVKYYPQGTLFSEYVPPYDWYGMTLVQWRTAIHTERSIAQSAGVAGFASAASSLRV
eukprot:CAMPEP_0173230332 /NCGR_PEP_ID=MMETSP1142-20121109/7702_1 /TAXON_ID=483371 /ORGANISM="non described non described, Strain CCMP2298" /LENGTH=911 /DNA_ID=CAMNT_0014159431 /DNA_START=16 /DNA_END=2751 /DNA_ORIENTATION=+